MVLIYILIFKFEIQEMSEVKLTEHGFAKIFVVSASIVITTLWAGELSGPRWSGTFELLISLYWLVAVNSLTDTDGWLKTMPTNVLVMASGIVHLWMEVYIAWIPFVCLMIEYYLIQHHKKTFNVPNTLFLMTSFQSAIVWYFKNGKCNKGMEIGLLCTLTATSVIFGLIHTFYYRKRTLVVCFALMMVVLSVIVDEEYICCLNEEESKWVAVSFLVIFGHAATVGFYAFVKTGTETHVELTDQVPLMNKQTEELRVSEF